MRLRPEHAVRATAPRPIRYLVVLDAGGSMSANFDGQCNARSVTGPPPGNIWQCANGPEDSPFLQVAAGRFYWWNTAQERRIYAAKRAAITLARQLNLAGSSGQDAARPPDQIGVVWFTDRVARSGDSHFTGFISNLSVAEREILAAGSLNGDPYRTEGGSNIAAGLYRAALALEAAPPTVTVDGTTYSYETRVLLITDSVANVFLDRSSSELYGGISSPETYPPGHQCRFIQDLSENAPCHTTEVGGLTTGDGGARAGMDRPITQAVEVSRDELQVAGVSVSVITLGNLSALGLHDGVASTPSSFYAAPTLQTGAGGETNVDQIVRALPGATPGATCTRIAASDWDQAMGPEERPQNSPLTFPVVGEVTLTSAATNNVFTAPIQADAATGELRYVFTTPSPGDYRLTAYLLYRGVDGVTRVYDGFDGGGFIVNALNVRVTAAGQILDTLSLRVTANVCAGP